MTGARPGSQQPPARDERLHYQRWLLERMLPHDAWYRQRLASQRLEHRPLISIITPVYNTPPHVLRRMLSSIKHQTYPFWELCLVDDGSSEPWLARMLEREAAADSRLRFHRREQNGGIVAASNDALALATGEFAAFIDHDDEVEPQALYEVARAINKQPDVDVLHTDFDTIDDGGIRLTPALWPDWSPERLQTLPYTVHLRVYRRACIDAVGRLRAGFDGAQDYDLALRLAERTDRIVHIPHILYHWRTGATSAAGNPDAKPYAYVAGIRALNEHLMRSGIQATRRPGPGDGMHVLHFDGATLPPVSIVAAVDPQTAVDPQAGDEDPNQAMRVLAACLTSLLARADVPVHEVVVAAPAGTHDAVRAALSALPPEMVRVVRWPADADEAADHPQADHALALNAAAQAATGDLLVLLGENLEPACDTWLSQLAGYAQQAANGAVGPKIHAPDGDVVHAGIVLPRGRPTPVRLHAPEEGLGIACAMRLVSNYSAVSGACLVTRRAVFADIGGLRATAQVGYSDVDYCLRLRERGYRIVLTTSAELRQFAPPPPVPAVLEQARLAAFQQQWPSLPAVDPYYNPNYNQENGGFLLGEP